MGSGQSGFGSIQLSLVSPVCGVLQGVAVIEQGFVMCFQLFQPLQGAGGLVLKLQQLRKLVLQLFLLGLCLGKQAGAAVQAAADLQATQTASKNLLLRTHFFPHPEAFDRSWKR